MSLYTLIIVTFIVFMAINVIIGLRGRKHASTTKDFLTASGQSGIWFIIASAVGASIGSGVVIGTTQYAVSWALPVHGTRSRAALHALSTRL